jgi:hypothetical protein
MGIPSSVRDGGATTGNAFKQLRPSDAGSGQVENGNFPTVLHERNPRLIFTLTTAFGYYHFLITHS